MNAYPETPDMRGCPLCVRSFGTFAGGIITSPEVTRPRLSRLFPLRRPGLLPRLAVTPRNCVCCPVGAGRKAMARAAAYEGERMIENGCWASHEEPPLTRDSFDALCGNRIPCIRVRGFASDAECDEFVAAMDAVGLHKTYAVPKLARPPRYVGMAQFEFRKRSKQDYFAHVDEAWREHDAVLARCGWNPVERMMSMIRGLYPESAVALAEEPGFGRYYAGIIRDTSGGGTLHADVTMYSAADYVIGSVAAQITWNFFATEVAAGGRTTIHNRPYRVAPRNDGGRVEIEGFDRAYVDGAETHVYAPGKGDVVLFNSHNPHEWTAVESGDRRMGIGTYIGRMADGNFIYWS